MEYWNVVLNKEVTHLLTSLSKGILPIVHLVQEKITQYSSIPIFQLCLPAIALAQARRAGAKRTKFFMISYFYY